MRKHLLQAGLGIIFMGAAFVAAADFTVTCYYGIKVDSNGEPSDLLYSSPPSCAVPPLLDVSNSGVPNCPTDGYIELEDIHGGVIGASGDERYFIAERTCIRPPWAQ